jgi:hypothetical protein
MAQKFTGMYARAHSSNDRIAFAVDGNERFFIDANGVNAIGNVYLTSGNSVRNYSGIWQATTGATGNGFVFTNTADSQVMFEAQHDYIRHTSDGAAADGATLYLKHANNNSTDTIGTIFFGNNADTTLSKIVAETNGANNTSNLKFGTSNAGTIATALTLNADNSATFAGNIATASTKKVLFDGASGHTYIAEESDSNLKFYVAGTEQLNITNGGLHFNSSLTIPDYINHASDTGTKFGFSADDTFVVRTGGAVRLTVNDTTATFTGNVVLGTGDSLYLNGTTGLRLLHDGSNALFINQTAGDFKIQNSVSDKDIIFKGKDGASSIDALTLDMSEGGNATFAGSITAGGARSIFAADTVVNSFSGVAGVEVYKNAGDSVLIIHQDDGNHESKLHFRTGGNDTQLVVPASSKALKLHTETTSDAVVFEMDGGATFKSTIEIDNNGAVVFDNSNNNNAWYVRNGGSNSATLQFGLGSPGSNIKHTFEGSGAVEFASALTIGGTLITAGGHYISSSSSTGFYTPNTNLIITAANNTNATGGISFKTNNAGTSTERMSISAAGNINVLGNTTFNGNAFGGTYLGVNTGGVTQWGANRGILTWGTGYASIYAGPSGNELWIGAGGATDKSIVLDGSTIEINKPINTSSGATFSGDITLDDNSGASPSLYLKNGNNNFWRLFCGSSEDLTFRLGTVTKLEIDSTGNAEFTGVVSVPTGKAFRLYNAAGSGWGEIGLEESENKIQFNRGIKPTGNLQSDQTSGTSTKRWHTVYAGTGNFSSYVSAGTGFRMASGQSIDFIDSNLGYNSIKRNTTLGGIQISTGGNSSMNLLDNGKVGVGGAHNPGSKFQVDDYTVGDNGTQNVYGNISSFSNSASENLFLGIKNAGYPNRGWAFNPVTNGVNSDLVIKEHGSTGERLRLISGGVVKVTGGTLQLGADVTIFRDGVNIIRTDDKLHANNDIYIGGSGKLFDRANNATFIQLAHPNMTFTTPSGRATFTGEVAAASMVFKTLSNHAKIEASSSTLFVAATNIQAQGNFIPDADNNSARKLGASNRRWRELHATTIYGDGSNITGVVSTDSSKLPLAGGTMTGNIQMSANRLQFDQSGTRSWQVYPSSGDLLLYSGDSNGTWKMNNNLYVAKHVQMDGALQQGAYSERNLSSGYFANGTANLGINIVFPNVQMQGMLKITLSGSYSHQNITGELVKTIPFGWNPGSGSTSGLYGAGADYIVKATGGVADAFTIGNITWNSSTSKYNIPIYHINSHGNSVRVKVEYFGGQAHQLQNISLTSPASVTIPSAYSSRHRTRVHGSFEITADGSNAVTLTESGSGDFTIDAADDIRLDAGGGDIVLRDDGVEFGRLTNSSGNLILKSGSTTMLTGSGANATFAGDITSTGLTVDYTGNRTGDAGILVTNDNDDWGIKVDKDGTADYGILSQTDGENAIVVRNAAGVNKIQLQGDGDATFSGAGTFGSSLKINAPDGAATAMTAVMNMHGYEGRGVGIKMKDSVNSASGSTDREWFVGTGYNSSGFNIGYASDGSQSSYNAQAKLAITTGGDATIYGNELIVAGINPYIKGTGTGPMRIKHTSGETMYLRPDETGAISIFEGVNSQSVYMMTVAPSANNTTNESAKLQFQTRSRQSDGQLNTKSATIKHLTHNIGSHYTTLDFAGSDKAKFNMDLEVTGNLNITGDINSTSVTNLDVTDKTITVAKGAADSAAADGAGIVVDGASASILYDHTGTQWEVNKPFEVKVGSSAITMTEYSNGAVIWLDGSDGDMIGGDYYNIAAYGGGSGSKLSFGYGAVEKMYMDRAG